MNRQNSNFFKMAEDELIEVNDFYNVHGTPIQVLENSTGDFFVSVKDILGTGFKIYIGDTFIPSMVNRKQIIKEFEMHMLTAAYNFLLTHQNKDVDESKVLQTIENCKQKLLGKNSGSKVSAGASTSYRNSNNPIRSQPRENQFHNKNASFATEKYLQKTDQDFRPKGYKNYQENLQPSNSNNLMTNVCSSSGSIDSQESILMRMLVGETLPYIDLEVGKVCTMKVCYIVRNRQNICWAHLQSDVPLLDEMTVNIFNMEPQLEDLRNPQEGQLVLGLFEGVWFRGKIISLNPTIVHYLDYGNRARTEALKVLPESFKKIPAFAFRLKLSAFPEGKLEDDLTFTVVVKMKYEDCTYLVEVIDNADDNIETKSIVNHQKKKCFEKKDFFEENDEFCNESGNGDAKGGFFGLPEPLIHLKVGTEVRLLDFQDGIIFVKTKECYDKTKEITSYIKELETTALSNVKVNQLVLSTMDNVPGLHRAIVTNVISNVVVMVKYLDYPGTNNVAVKSLKNVDEYLAKQPINLLPFPGLDGLKNVDMEAMKLLEEMVKRKDRVTLVNYNGKFDLKLSTGQFLSDVLANYGGNEF